MPKPGQYSILNSINDSALVLDSNYTILFVNQHFLDMVGLDELEVTGKKCYEVVRHYPQQDGEECLPGSQCVHKQVFSTGNPVTATHIHVLPDNTKQTVEIYSAPIRETNGRVTSVLLLMKDITSQSEIQEDLVLYRQLIDQSNDSFFIIDPETGQVLDVNEEACLRHGYNRDEFLKLKVSDFATSVKSEDAWKDKVRSIQSKGAAVFDGTHSRRDGTIFPAEISAKFVKNQGRDFLVATVRDITERKLAEKELKEREVRFREIFRNMSSCVAIYEPVEEGKDFIFKDLNPAGCESSRLKKEDVIGKSVLEVFPGMRSLGLFDIFQQVFRTGQPVKYPTSQYKDDRVEMWVENYVCKLPSGEIAAVYDDVSKRVEIERELIKSRDEWEKTFHTVSDIVSLQDHNMRIIKINQAGCTILGMSSDQILGRHCYELFRGINEPCEECPILLAADNYKPYTNRMYHEKLGKTFLVSASPVINDSGELEYIAHVAKDISEQMKMEEQLFLAQKLETVAGLAAGVAHEINTPLSAILQSIEVIRFSLAEDQPENLHIAAESGVDLHKVNHYLERKEVDFFLEGIRSSALNASRIITSLLEFSRPQQDEMKSVRLPDLIDSALALALSDYELKKIYDILNVEVIKEYPPELPQVSCNPIEIEQVLLNLIKNAIQAMIGGGQEMPCLHIRVDVKDDMICVEVRDNGPGLTEEARTQVFDPFYSTKEVGAGTGLGLYVSYVIIHDKHNGTIQVDSKPGEGANFIVTLPIDQRKKEQYVAE